MKIAVSGGTGFIGSHFLKRALAAGHQVIALRRNTHSKTRIPLSQTPIWLDRQLNEATANDLRNCDALVHLAAHTGNIPYDDLTTCLHWNLTSVLAFFEQARIAGIRRFIVAGSCFEYGKSGERFDFIPTDAPLEPTNSYAASKAAASIAILQWAKEHELSLEILRVFHVYGEGELKSRFWPSLKRAALAGHDFPMTEGEQIRDFMNVDDVAETFLHRTTMTYNTLSSAQVFNLSSGEVLNIQSFAKRWWKNWNANGQLIIGSIPYRNGEVMRYVPGNNLINISRNT